MPAPVPVHEAPFSPEASLEGKDEAFRAALARATTAFDDGGLPYLMMGGIASTILGRRRPTHDIDVFVRPTDALQALALLAGAGFETEETFPDWLFKAYRDGQLVDVIFRSSGDIYLDEDMLARSRVEPYLGHPVRVIPPEDLAVIKAVVHAEHMPRHWHDAVAILGTADIDWEYLVRRARRGVRRVLALLLYAQSCDLPVPAWAVERLHALLRDGR
ncbi:MAG TPA: nucleotidyltransferase [Acidimicrobiales bacterium]|nr:nucleotidyltransferase [Acidimicrobiales bacterium]